MVTDDGAEKGDDCSCQKGCSRKINNRILSDKNSKHDIEIIEQQCGLNAIKPAIEKNIAAGLDLLTQHANNNDGLNSSVKDVNGEIAAIGNYVIVHSPNKEAGAQRWPDAWRAKLFTE